MHQRTWTIIALFGLAFSASAQDGGRLAWRGKGGEDPKTAMADASGQGRAMMLFFTSEGSGPSKALSAGAFSSPKVIEASQALSCIFVDCDWGKKHGDLAERYKVRGYPTVVFCDPEGKPIGHLDERDPESVAKRILEVSAKYTAKLDPKLAVPQIAGRTYLQARADARRLSKPMLLYFSDDSPASTSVNLALVDDLLKDTIRRFVFAKGEYRKGSDDCVKFDVSRAPTILVLDCSLEKPEEKPLARISGSRSARELKRDLEGALSSPSGDPSPTTSKPSGPTPGPKQPEEKLSDDELDRRFIQARLAVAMDMIKGGKKEKAIEVLEDILKTYPKHVDTLAAKKLLEDLRN
jgi:hypothetical protein